MALPYDPYNPYGRVRQPPTQDDPLRGGAPNPGPVPPYDPNAPTPATDPNAPPQTNPNLNQPVVKPEDTPNYQPPAPTPWGAGTPDVDSYGLPQYTASSFGSAPSGWDPSKWNDPLHQTPKYVWGRIYQEAQASGDPNWMQTAIQRFQQAYPGTTYGGKDVIYTPWGEEVDIFRDYGTDPRSANGVSWQVNGGPTGPVPGLPMLGSSSPGGATPITGGAGGGAGGNEFANPQFQSVIEQLRELHPQWAEYQAWKNGQGGTASMPAPQTAPTTAGNSLEDEYRKRIMELLGTPQDVDAESLRQSPEAQAQRLAAQRAMERDRAQLAEETAYGGEGNFGGRVRQLGQARSESETQFIGQLAQQKMMENRERLMQGIQFAMADGQFEQAQALQRELAQLNAQLEREGISAQRDIAGSDIALRGQLGNRGLDLQGRELDDAMKKFGLSLGFDYAQLQQLANREAVLAMLGG